MKKNILHNPINNSSGFIVADFLFAFVMVIGIGIFIFALTFSLATIEVAQYIVWSSARNYSAGAVDAQAAYGTATRKFENLTAKFPLLTGNGASVTPWFELTDFLVGDLATIDPEFSAQITSEDKTNENRQPWTGARAIIKLKLFAGLQIPFLGKVAEDPSTFEFPIRAFIIRHPSRGECRKFFYTNSSRFKAIRELENGNLANSNPATYNPAETLPTGLQDNGGFGEDNGC